MPIPSRSAGGVTRLSAYALADPDAGVGRAGPRYDAPRTPEGFTGAEIFPHATDPSTAETLYLVGDDLHWLDVGQAGGTRVIGRRSGNPGSGEKIGCHVEVLSACPDGSCGRVRVWRGAHELEVGGTVEPRAHGADQGWRVEALLLVTGASPRPGRRVRLLRRCHPTCRGNEFGWRVSGGRRPGHGAGSGKRRRSRGAWPG